MEYPTERERGGIDNAGGAVSQAVALQLVAYYLLSPLNSGVGAVSPCRLGNEMIHAESTDKSGRIWKVKQTVPGKK